MATLLSLTTMELSAQGSARRTQLMGTPVTFTTNVAGVTVTINSTPYTGTLPQTINFQPGTYQLVAKASGYQDFTSTFTVVANHPQTVNIVMQGGQVQVTFTSNAPNTIMTLNNSRLSRPLPQTVSLNPGTYQITAEAPGFQPLSTSVTVTGSTTIPLMFQSANVAVQFTSNAPGTTISINGNPVPRPLPQQIQIAPGSYQIVAQAPGFQTLSTTVNVTGSTTIPLTLQGATFQVQFISNVPNTRITVDGNSIRHPLPQVVQLTQGTHQVTAVSPGFQDSVTMVEINGPQTVSVSLLPLIAQVRAQGVQVFIDGILQTTETFDVQPGRRTLRVVSGGLVSEQVFNFAAGRTYNITPVLSFTIQ